MRQQGNSDAVCPGCCRHVLPGMGRVPAVCYLPMEMVLCDGICLSCLLGWTVHAVLSTMHCDHVVSEESDEKEKGGVNNSPGVW